MNHSTIIALALCGQFFGQDCRNGNCYSAPASYFELSRPYVVPPTIVLPPRAPDGLLIVPGSVRIVDASAPRALARPAARPKAVAAPVILERVPTAEPGPRYHELRPVPNVIVPEGPPRSPVAPSAAARSTVGTLAAAEPSAAKRGPPMETVVVPVPAVPEAGYIVKLPHEFPAPVVGLPSPNAPSQVHNQKGNTLPNFAVTGMVWKPGKDKDGSTASPHAESHRFVEELNTGAPLPNLVDDTGKWRVTVIASDPSQRRAAVEDLKKGNGPLAPFKDKILVRSGAPTDWIVRDIGLDRIKEAAEGNPGIVIQEPNGRVVMAIGRHTQEGTAEALRKANPEFDPSKVPGTGNEYPLGFDRKQWLLILGGAASVVILVSTKDRDRRVVLV